MSDTDKATPPADPMDTPLPCDVTVGHGTMRKGVALRTLVSRMQLLNDMAHGEPLTSEQQAQNLAILQGKLRLVPVEPSESMTYAGARHLIDGPSGESYADEATRVYKAMLAAAPQPTGPAFTGNPPGLLQDDSRGLSRALASKPDAMKNAREAAAAIAAPPEESYIDRCDAAFVRDFCPYKGSPDPHVVWRSALAAPPAAQAEPTRVYLVATGLTHEGEELYTRHDTCPPLCDAETLYAAPPAAQADVVEALEYLFLSIATRADSDYRFRALRRAEKALMSAMPGWTPPVPAAPAAQAGDELRPLPEPEVHDAAGYRRAYTADQMRDYARAARASLSARLEAAERTWREVCEEAPAGIDANGRKFLALSEAQCVRIGDVIAAASQEKPHA